MVKFTPCPVFVVVGPAGTVYGHTAAADSGTCIQRFFAMEGGMAYMEMGWLAAASEHGFRIKVADVVVREGIRTVPVTRPGE